MENINNLSSSDEIQQKENTFRSEERRVGKEC